MKKNKVRVRFAPSPTGPLHIGGVRTALFNYLFARRNNGVFILRIEDTDRERYVPGAEEYIIESLRWCGIETDEGVPVGGPCNPYHQSDRKDIYRQYALQLIECGDAYYAFDTPEELDEIRKEYEKENKGVFQYDSSTRKMFTNSVTLSESEVKDRLTTGEPFVIRYRMPENETVVFTDEIRGKMEVNTSTLDDKVLYKSDGMPTYHLANVVDDHLMEISHVIRGEEWLPSLPLHIMLYRSLGWEKQMPVFAHLPLLLKPSGQGKLSKRDGDKMGFPVFPLQWEDPQTGDIATGYREEGYFPGAFVNILALLGWNPGTEKEIFSMEELIESFSLEKVGKSGARFDPGKARWFNHKYLVEKPDGEISKLFIPVLREKGVDAAPAKVQEIVCLVKERVSFVHELWDESFFFFVRPEKYDRQVVKKKWKPDTPVLLSKIAGVLEKVEPFEAVAAEAAVKSFLEQNGTGAGKVMLPLRLALVGESKGPGLFNIASMLGKEETLARINMAIKTLGEGEKN